MSLKRFPWAAYREDTANIKLSVGLNHATVIPEFVALSDGSENDMLKAESSLFPKVISSPSTKDISNNFTLSAGMIGSIHKDRWKVEPFFKAIKQNLKIKAFVGVSKNAVLTRIWIALIVYLLVPFARHSAKEGWTVQRMLRVLQFNLFERKALRDIFNPSPPPNQKDQPQMRLVL